MVRLTMLCIRKIDHSSILRIHSMVSRTLFSNRIYSFQVKNQNIILSMRNLYVLIDILTCMTLQLLAIIDTFAALKNVAETPVLLLCLRKNLRRHNVLDPCCWSKRQLQAPIYVKKMFSYLNTELARILAKFYAKLFDSNTNISLEYQFCLN